MSIIRVNKSLREPRQMTERRGGLGGERRPRLIAWSHRLVLPRNTVLVVGDRVVKVTHSFKERA